MATTASVVQPADPYLNSLVSGTRWVGTITFSFPNASTDYQNPYSVDNEPNTFGALNGVQQSAARLIFGQFAAVANLTFSEVFNNNEINSDIRMAESDAPSTAWAYGPSVTPVGGDVWFNKADYNNPVAGNYGWVTFVHEMGHSMGLNHPHENGMPLDRDSLEFTVMTYRSFIGDDVSGYNNAADSYPTTLMMYDIAALQYMYGANYNTQSGNTVYQWDPNNGRMIINAAGQPIPVGNKVFLTVWDGGGTDTYDMSNYTTAVSINLNPGGWSVTAQNQLADLDRFTAGGLARGNVFNALLFNGDTRSLIENATGGSNNDTLLGNQGNNELRGNGGNDTIVGYAGSDTSVVSGTYAQYMFNASGTGAQIVDTIGGRDGTDAIFEVEFVRFADQTVKYHLLGARVTETFTHNLAGWSFDAVLDIDGDGDGDFLLRGTANNQLVTWQMQNFAISGAVALSNNMTGWTVAGTGDFNGDGTADLLWRGSAQGALVLWNMQNGSISAGHSVATNTLGFTIQGLGNFDTDGDSGDILWRGNTNSELILWRMSNQSIQAGVVVHNNISGWTVVGVGDFDGDNDTDVILAATDGTTVGWRLQNGAIVGGNQIKVAANPATVAGVGDFNGNGTDDILWRNANGSYSITTMAGGAVTAGITVTILGGSSVRGIGDFNNDGRDDILVADLSGLTNIWNLNPALPGAPEGGTADHFAPIASDYDFA